MGRKKQQKKVIIQPVTYVDWTEQYEDDIKKFIWG